MIPNGYRGSYSADLTEVIDLAFGLLVRKLTRRSRTVVAAALGRDGHTL
jgi:hypothetical protein